MAELLSMALLSTEPVSAAKPLAISSDDSSLASDTGFAATLAAEVSGQKPEKAVKGTAKTGQNTATELAHKELATTSDVTAAEDGVESLKSDQSVTEKPIAEEPAELPELDLRTAAHDEPLAGQSQLLDLLEKAKTLHERLSNTEKAEKVTESKLVKAANLSEAEQLLAEVAEPTEPAEPLIEQKVNAALATAIELKHEKSKATDSVTETSGSSGKTKTESKTDAAIVIQDSRMTELSSQQPLTDAELKALKLLAQTDKTPKLNAAAAQASKSETAPVISGQISKAEVDAEFVKKSLEQHTESAITAVSQDQPTTTLLKAQKDSDSESGKTLQIIDKTIKAPNQTLQASLTAQAVQTALVDQSEHLQPDAVLQQVMPFVVGKSQLSTDSVSLTSKSLVLASGQVEETTDTATDSATSLLADTKNSVQAQSAAALVAPAVVQNKPVVAETKTSTEDALKQLQTSTAMAAQGEQGSSASSGDSRHQGATDMVQNVVEQQKNNIAMPADPSSFSSQLKSGLEKAGSGITVSSRELSPEQSQKQVDQLGQKLSLIHPEASNQLKDKMLMMVKDKVHTAEIRLDPSELGSMQIKINLQQDQMSVQFLVQQGNAKELMEQQMPKLKELLQQQGIELSQGSVQQQNQSSSGREGGRRSAGGAGPGLDAADELIDSAVLPAKNSDRVVDYYA